MSALRTPAQDAPVRMRQHPRFRWHKGLSLCSRAAGATGAQIGPAGILAEGRGLS